MPLHLDRFQNLLALQCQVNLQFHSLVLLCLDLRGIVLWCQYHQ